MKSLVDCRLNSIQYTINFYFIDNFLFNFKFPNFVFGNSQNLPELLINCSFPAHHSKLLNYSDSNDHYSLFTLSMDCLNTCSQRLWMTGVLSRGTQGEWCHYNIFTWHIAVCCNTHFLNLICLNAVSFTLHFWPFL